MVSGIYGQFLSLDWQWAVEPRIGLEYKMKSNQQLTFGYGLHSQMAPIETYFDQVQLADGSYITPNKTIGFTRSNHLIAGYQKGFKELKPSTRQRFVSLSFVYSDKKTEEEILVKETGVEDSVAKKLVGIGEKIRNLTELGLAETVSTRLLVDAAILINSGLPKRLACNVAVAEPLTDDEDTLEAIKDLISLSI